MADSLSAMSPPVEFAFAITRYPGSGRQVESESEPSEVYAPDLPQGAFMGDAVLELGDVDFSTRFGRVTLIDWCLRLSAVPAELERDGQGVAGFSESDDLLSCRRYAEMVFVAAGYRPGIAVVRDADFAGAVRGFIDDRISWVAREFPAAMRNPAMADVLPRLGLPILDRGETGPVPVSGRTGVAAAHVRGRRDILRRTRRPAGECSRISRVHGVVSAGPAALPGADCKIIDLVAGCGHREPDRLAPLRCPLTWHVEALEVLRPECQGLEIGPADFFS